MESFPLLNSHSLGDIQVANLAKRGRVIWPDPEFRIPGHVGGSMAELTFPERPGEGLRPYVERFAHRIGAPACPEATCAPGPDDTIIPIDAKPFSAGKHWRDRHALLLGRFSIEPDHVPHPYYDAEAYIAGLDPTYLRQLRFLASQIPRMGALNRFSNMTPAAAGQEGEHIFHTLQQLVGQTCNPEQFEIVVFANTVHGDKRPSLDGTLDAIRQAQHEFPEHAIHLMTASIHDDIATIGLIRKILADVIVLRHLARGPNGGNLYLQRCDADIIALHEKMIDSQMARLESDPPLDGIRGRIFHDPRAYVGRPKLFLEDCLLFGSLGFGWERQGRREYGLPHFACPVGSYAMVGGYGHRHEVGEDIAFSRRLTQFRGHPYCIERGDLDSMLLMSARRAVCANDQGIASYRQWYDDRSGFRLEDNEIRSSVVEPGGDALPENPSALNAWITATVRDFITGGYFRYRDLDPRFLGQLGIQFGVREDRFYTDDAEGFRRHYEGFCRKAAHASPTQLLECAGEFQRLTDWR